MPKAADYQSGRLLCGWTQARLAELARISPKTLERIEAGKPLDPELVRAVDLVLTGRGVVFGAPGDVRLGARRAPTPQAVGALTGARMKRGRFALRLDGFALTVRSGVSRAQVRRIEAAGNVREGIDQAHVFAVFGAIEAAGFRFGKVASTDALVAPWCAKCATMHRPEDLCGMRQGVA
ncbi:MAG TPA: helix-turn-helix transcriptional regulator [Caulobacteraceae bacterium]|nr:helix-turn-helix transcriptional regulator [Caulobacteraceae bacterium]